MMNPQYLPPGQNNNAPNNPLHPQTSQDFNGVQNANIYGQMPSNGSQKPYDSDMAHKMQNMNLNGPQGFPSSQLPPGQGPPGSNFAPTSNFGPNQMPPGQMPPGSFPASRPVSGAQPQQQKPLPTSSIAGLQGFQMPPPSHTPDAHRQPQGPPMQRPPSQPGQMGPQSGPQGPQPGQMPPNPQSGPQPSSGPIGRPGGPPQSQHPNPGMPPQMTGPQAGLQQPGQGPGVPPQPRMQAQPGQPGLAPQSQPGSMPTHPGQPSFSQPGLPPQPGPPGQPGLPPQPGQTGLQRQPGRLPQPGQPGLPPQPGHAGLPSQPGPMHGQPGRPSQPGQPGLPPQPGSMPQSGLNMPHSQPGPMPGQPGPMPGQPGPMPGQSGPMPGQPGPMPGQPGPMPGQHGQMFGQPSQMPGHPGQMPGQPGQMPGQPGQMPGQPGQMPSQPGLPPQPAHPGLPPQPQPGPMPGQMPVQPGMPSPQAQYNQFQTMPGLPHMPPPASQQRQYPGSGNQQPGFPQPPGQPTAGYPGMPPMAAQQVHPQHVPGQAPQPGYGQPAAGYPGQQYAAPFPGQHQYQQPQKRLDPDQMPSPIQVMADDQHNRSGIFVTNEKGQVPPLVTTDFLVDDKGNASPRYIRSSMYSVPVTADLLKQTAMPFCLVISPMAETVGSEMEPPLLDFAALTGSPTMGPVRCARCKAYMCPNMKFVDAGRHFKCAFCKASTEVPMEYTQYVNSMQQYGRVPAEMALGAYEIVATNEYCRNNTLPNPPAMVFVIDVSYNAMKSGLVDTVCENVMEIIEAMPKDEQTGKSWTRVGFITYSSTVHFYNIKGSLAQPQMMSVGDVGDMFVPLLEGFLVTAEESGPVLQQLLQQLPHMFRDNKETEIILLPAVQAGLEALKAAETSGQLLVFHTSLPSYNAPGKLLNREDRKLLGTEKEKQILNPQTTAYNELGQACSAAGVSVELFVCNNSYSDAATIGQLARLTGGQLHKYTYFTADVDGPRLISMVKRVAARTTAHDAVMRVRTSTGVRPTDFYGHYFMSNTTDVELAAIDADKAIGIEVKHDDKLTAEDGVYVQVALLYTHRSGQRRLRVLNLALNVAQQLADVYRSAELDTCINFLTKQAVWALREHPPRQVREGLSTRCSKSLAAYRRHCASPSSAGQLVLPESMKLLPLYTSCVLRSDAVAGGPDITCDDRSCAMYRALTADVATSVVYTYPRLLPLHALQDMTDPGSLSTLRASVDKMADYGVYLLENGVHMLLWVGSQASPEFVQDVFGVTSPQQIDTQVCELPELDNTLNTAVRAVVDDARNRRHVPMRLTVMRQHDKLEAVLRHFLVEDRGVDGSASYVDYLCHVHKEIRALL